MFWNCSIIYFLLLVHTLPIGQTLSVKKDQPGTDWLFPSAGARIYTTESNGTYFGYSVASYVGQSMPFALVGAPKARNTYDFLGADVATETGPAEEMTKMFGSSTGLVYRLDLDMEYPDCSKVPIADNNEDRRQHGTQEPGASLWIGGLVASTSNDQDGLQLVCDPRYLYTPASSNKSGLPGLRMENMGTGTCALYTGVSMQYTPIDACASSEEGACLSGFSGAIAAGREPGEAFVALGMPGSYLTEGNVFFGHYHGQQIVKALRLKSSPQDLKHRGFNLGYAVDLYKHPRCSTEDPYTSSAAAFDSSHCTAKDRFTILASSPMWMDNEYRGIVMILSEALNLESISYINDEWGHIGSFFGYSVTTADLNGDGIPEVIIGAPYYTENQRFKESQLRAAAQANGMQSDDPSQSEKPTNQFKSVKPDVGRVYVFYGKSKSALDPASYMEEDSGAMNNGDADYLSEPPVVLKGSRWIGGRFGHAVVSMGDVDGDGIDDLAVACPFCQDYRNSPNKGAVFVYLGRKDRILDENPDQVIYPADLPAVGAVSCEGSFDTPKPSKRQFSAFGWSLAAKSDVDKNLSPDVVVGDYASEQVVTLRSRNMVWFERPSWQFPNRPTLDWSGPNSLPCGQQCQYRISLELIMRAREAFFSPDADASLQFSYRIDLDSRITSERDKRLYTVDEGLSVVSGGVTFSLADLQSDGIGSRRLKLLELVVEPLRQQTKHQLWKPVVVNASVELVPGSMEFLLDKRAETPSWSLHPLKGSRVFLSKPIYFSNPDCGFDDICVPDLRIEVYDTSEGFDFGADGPSVIYYRERISERNITVAVRNLGENAYDTKVRVKIPAQFGYIPDKNFACKIETEGRLLLRSDGAATDIESSEPDMTTVVCNLPNPFIASHSQWHKLRFQLSTSGVFQPPEGLRVKRSNVPDDNTSTAEGEEDEGDAILSTWKPPKKLEIVAEVTSDNENMRDRQISAAFSYDLKLLVDVLLSSSSVGHTVFDRRNFSSQFTERQRIHPESIGPEFEQIFLVSNLGPSPIENVWVNLSIPLQTVDGDFLIYLLDVIRKQNPDGGPPLQVTVTPEVVSADGQLRGACYMPQFAINPLRLNAVDRKVQSSSSRPLLRRRRQADKIEPSDVPNSREARSTAADLLGDRVQQQKIVSCDRPLEDLGVPICLQIPCKIDRLGRGDAVRIFLTGWIWADTLFRHKFSDIAVVTTAVAQIPTTAFGMPVHGNISISVLSVSHNFVFEGIKMLTTQKIPILPVIVGVVLGILLLIIIIIVMWRCGFFKRARLAEDAEPPAPTENGNSPTHV